MFIDAIATYMLFKITQQATESIPNRNGPMDQWPYTKTNTDKNTNAGGYTKLAAGFTLIQWCSLVVRALDFVYGLVTVKVPSYYKYKIP